MNEIYKIAFVELGKTLSALSKSEINVLAQQAKAHNGWFTQKSILNAIDGIVTLTNENDLTNWLSEYKIVDSEPKKVGVIMAGNIPFVGFHDAMCVLLSGNILYAKLSSDDKIFSHFIFSKLFEIEPSIKKNVVFTESMKEIDALIATGSDNSARYFDYYFSKIPRIIRKNRTSIAILDGTETEADFKALGNDIFTYFGLGCRNIAKLFVPQNYTFDLFFESIFEFGFDMQENNKYSNNYDYHKALFLMNQDPFLDNNFLMLRESKQLFSPVSVLYYQRYQKMDEVLDFINSNQTNIQCIVSKTGEGNIKFGQTQMPKVNQYADNVDTMQFLTKL